MSGRRKRQPLDGNQGGLQTEVGAGPADPYYREPWTVAMPRRGWTRRDGPKGELQWTRQALQGWFGETFTSSHAMTGEPNLANLHDVESPLSERLSGRLAWTQVTRGNPRFCAPLRGVSMLPRRILSSHDER